MASITPTTLPTVYVETPTSDSLTVSGDGDIAIVSVSASPFLPQGISVSFSGATISISGSYPVGLFDSLAIRTIERQKSDKSSEVLTYTSFDDIPGNRQVFSYKSPSQPRVTITYTVTASETDAETMEEVIHTFTVTKDIEFNYDIGKNILGKYI
jgi:hypothetical protein